MTHQIIRRVYVDTSVVGGAFDKEFDWQTEPFWKAVRNRKIVVIESNILRGEVERAPKHVREFYFAMPDSQIERVISTEESNTLAARYIAEKVVGKTSLDDCKHIALATLSHADVLVSWNFKHIVNVVRIKGYNSVNMKLGYPQIEIRTPYEVIHDNT